MFSENISLLVKLLLDAKFEKITIEDSVVIASRLYLDERDVQEVKFHVGRQYVKYLAKHREQDIRIELADLKNYIENL